MTDYDTFIYRYDLSGLIIELPNSLSTHRVNIIVQ